MSSNCFVCPTNSLKPKDSSYTVANLCLKSINRLIVAALDGREVLREKTVYLVLENNHAALSGALAILCHVFTQWVYFTSWMLAGELTQSFTSSSCFLLMWFLTVLWEGGQSDELRPGKAVRLQCSWLFSGECVETKQNDAVRVCVRLLVTWRGLHWGGLRSGLLPHT